MTHVVFCKLLYGGFILGESESVYNCVFVFSKFLLNHIILKADELFVLFAYHSIDDYYFNVFIVDLGATYYLSLVKQQTYLELHKGPVKLMQWVKIAHSFLQSVSDQFHVIILSLPV